MPVMIVGLLLVGLGVGFGDRRVSSVPVSSEASDKRALSVTWVDGDSGHLDGRPFRLHGVDAPEGSQQRAKCARERELSGGARDAARNLTKRKQVRIAREHGQDDYGRVVVDLVVDGKDVASQLVGAGVLRRWDFDGGEPKPDWC